MPRLIPPELGNGRRPSDPSFQRATAVGSPGPNEDTAIPVLDVSDDTHDLIGAQHDAALDPNDETGLLLGTLVCVENRAPRDGSRPGPIVARIGASTLHEAATEIVNVVSQLALDMPAWVASTDPVLADVLAEHFTVRGYSSCKVLPIDEVVV